MLRRLATRLAWRRKRVLIVAGIAVALVSVLAIIPSLRGGAASRSGILRPGTVAARGAARIPGVIWEPLALPVPIEQLGWLSFMPAPNDPQTLTICAVRVPDTAGPHLGALLVATTHDGGATWATAQGLPATRSATTCELHAAPDDVRALALFASWQIKPTDCGAYDIYLSHDGGATWHKTPTMPPDVTPPGTLSYCMTHLEASAGHLYVLGSAGTWVTTRDGGYADPAPTVIHRSDDGGASWRRISIPGSSVRQWWLTLMGDGERLLATGSRSVGTSEAGTDLLTSADAGVTWHTLAMVAGNVSGSTPRLPWAASGPLPTTSLPWYLPTMDQVPSRLYRLRVTQVMGSVHAQWLPPLPIAGATPARTGLTTVLASTDAGALLALGLGPDEAVPPASMGLDTSAHHEQWLWEWDPKASRWSTFTAPLPLPWPQHCSAACFQARLSAGDGPQGIYVWVSSAAGTPLYRAHLPSTASVR